MSIFRRALLLCISFSFSFSWSFTKAFGSGFFTRPPSCLANQYAVLPSPGCDNSHRSPSFTASQGKRSPACPTPLHAFPRRGSDNGYDDHGKDEEYDENDDNDDDEPPSLSTSPQEFLLRMQQKEDANGDAAPAAYGPGRGRSAPRIRPAFGAKKSPSSSSKGNIATVHVCTNCGSEYVQWRGRCVTCSEWNTIQECRAERKPSSAGGGGKARAVFGGRKGASRGGGSSWLDGLPGDGGGGGGPARVTDVYREILGDPDGAWGDSSREGARSGGSRERRTLVPDDPEMNAVLGGGLMPGSISLVGGEPGVGKSTLLLQMAGSVASMAARSLRYQGIGMGPPKPSSTTNPGSEEDENSGTQKQRQQQQNGGPVLYISGEENTNQIASRALRLGIRDPELLLWCETDADVIADGVASAADGGGPQTSHDEDAESPPMSRPPSLVIIDSIQTMLCDAAGSSAAGGITQVRECVGLFLRLAKSTGVPIVLVGHVTKNGDVAGPRTVEHMVDAVLYLESGGAGAASLRVLRAAKNRFGSSEEVGVYEMGGDGRLLPVSDPSSLFLSTRQDTIDAEGCAISVVLEGMRSMTVEVQALVAYSAGSGGYAGRRVVDGISNSRLLLILAVLHKRYGISFQRRDVYVNVVGGMRLSGGGTDRGGDGSDLAVSIAAVSSLVGIPVRSDTAFVGEVGLLGELRPVRSLERRIREAERMGFSRIVVPSSSSSGGKGKTPWANGGGSGSGGPGRKGASGGGIKRLVCDNVLDAINCGLVTKLPTSQTRSGPKLMKPKRRAGNGSRRDETKSFDMDDLDIILDNEDDDIYT